MSDVPTESLNNMSVESLSNEQNKIEDDIIISDCDSNSDYDSDSDCDYENEIILGGIEEEINFDKNLIRDTKNRIQL